MRSIGEKIMIEVYTDGATSNNGYENAVGGAAWIILQENVIIDSGSKNIKNATNNICELEAIIEGCKKAEELAILEQDGEFEFYENIYVYSDSAYIINCYSQKWWVNWERNSWVNSKKQKVANKELWESLIYYFKKPNFYFKKVPGHSNNKWNNYVDKLAVQAKFDF